MHLSQPCSGIIFTRYISRYRANYTAGLIAIANFVSCHCSWCNLHNNFCCIISFLCVVSGVLLRQVVSLKSKRVDANKLYYAARCIASFSFQCDQCNEFEDSVIMMLFQYHTYILCEMYHQLKQILSMSMLRIVPLSINLQQFIININRPDVFAYFQRKHTRIEVT